MRHQLAERSAHCRVVREQRRSERNGEDGSRQLRQAGDGCAGSRLHACLEFLRHRRASLGSVVDGSGCCGVSVIGTWRGWNRKQSQRRDTKAQRPTKMAWTWGNTKPSVGSARSASANAVLESSVLVDRMPVGAFGANLFASRSADGRPMAGDKASWRFLGALHHQDPLPQHPRPHNGDCALDCHITVGASPALDGTRRTSTRHW